jgi:hypothetical protein
MVTKATKKSAAKKGKATTKSPATKVKANEGLPSPELTEDLTEVFKRHGWTGLPQHLSFASTSDCDRQCDDGSTPVTRWINCPGGITKRVCVCPGEDPSC